MDIHKQRRHKIGNDPSLFICIFYLMEVMYKEGEGRGIQKMRVCFIKVGTKNESTQSTGGTLARGS